MKHLSLDEVKDLLKEYHNYCIRMNEFTRQIHLVKFNINFLDEILGYITFEQFIKLDLTIGLVELPINSFMYYYYTLKKEVK